MRHSTFGPLVKFLVALIVIILTAFLACYFTGLNNKFIVPWLQEQYPGFDFGWALNHGFDESTEETESTEAVASAEPSATPTPETTPIPTPTLAPTPVETTTPVYVYVYITPEPTFAPTATPTYGVGATVPTYGTNVPTYGATVPAPVFANREEISFRVAGKTVRIYAFTYSGGPNLGYAPWFVAEQNKLQKETEDSFGAPVGENWSESLRKMLEDICVDPWLLAEWRVLCSLEGANYTDQADVNRRAEEMLRLPVAEYDKLANEFLDYWFKNLKDGEGHLAKNWGLELQMKWSTPEKTLPMLFGKKNGDSNHKPDVLIYFTAKGKTDSFHSSRKALELAGKDAGDRDPRSHWQTRCYFNLTEHYTIKWKKREQQKSAPADDGGSNNNNTPSQPQEQPKEQPKEEPKKDVTQRIQEGPGSGTTNPNNASDAKTDSVRESTTSDRPNMTTDTKAEEAVTQPPEAQNVRVEDCGPTNVNPPKREDQLPAPKADPNHNVPAKDAEVKNDPAAEAGEFNIGDV